MTEQIPLKPWKVYAGKLRPQFPTPIVEIHGVNGVVLPWTV